MLEMGKRLLGCPERGWGGETRVPELRGDVCDLLVFVPQQEAELPLPEDHKTVKPAAH